MFFYKFSRNLFLHLFQKIGVKILLNNSTNLFDVQIPYLGLSFDTSKPNNYKNLNGILKSMHGPMETIESIFVR